MFAIEAQNITKVYENGFLALNNINLSIEKGRVCGLLGPNGAGKSTFINIISGAIKKTSGKLKILNMDNDKYTQDIKLKLGVVPQEIVNEPIFTVYEVLDFFSGMYGVRKNDRKKRINEVLEALNLADKKNVRARTLSGGMKRRLMVAKALIHNPEIVILDEPTAGVDVELRQNIWNYVRDLNKKGITIIFTTHYLEEAEKLCEKIAIINKGKLITYDSTEKLKFLFGETIINAKVKNDDFVIDKKNNNDIIEFNNKNVKIVTKTGNESYYIQELAIKGYIENINIEHPSLEDIFVKLVNNDK
ncbi:MAG: ABC transporter ATP-binding protein [Candidatus Sericytochromatia bacterium]|nr:MAG: ABC transporter ATP-binding protein [Candidatus Sericytochromatia bacterium]